MFPNRPHGLLVRNNPIDFSGLGVLIAAQMLIRVSPGDTYVPITSTKGRHIWHCGVQYVFHEPVPQTYPKAAFFKHATSEPA
jgi:hypothetical protein